MPELIGHRGARFEAPENSIAGFRYARALGITTFELDVHLTRDGKLAVIHDALVDRTTNATGSVSDFTAAELAALDARSMHADWPEPVGVPQLFEVFDLLVPDPLVSCEIEIKTDVAERLDQVVPLVLAEVGRYSLRDRVTLTSFDRTALERVKTLDPMAATGFIGKFADPADLEEALELGAARVGLNITTSSREVAQAAKANGLLTVGWPSNDAEAWNTLLDWGVDFLCTDSPTAAIAYLRSLGYRIENGRLIAPGE